MQACQAQSPASRFFSQTSISVPQLSLNTIRSFVYTVMVSTIAAHSAASNSVMSSGRPFLYQTSISVPQLSSNTGSRYLEIDFPLFSKGTQFTDDSVMTIAVAEALMDSMDAPDKEVKKALVSSMQKWGHKYPYNKSARRSRRLKKIFSVNWKLLYFQPFDPCIGILQLRVCCIEIICDLAIRQELFDGFNELSFPLAPAVANGIIRLPFKFAFLTYSCRKFGIVPYHTGKPMKITS